MPAPTNKTFTVQEASYLAGRPRKVVDKAVERGEVTKKKRKGKGGLLQLKLSDVRYLAAQELVSADVTPKGRTKLYRAIKKSAFGQQQVRFGDLVLDMTGVDKKVGERFERLSHLNAVIKVSGQSTPVIKGTAIPVYLIASLAKGQGIEATLTDYPSLTRVQVEAAREYAKAYPKPGRPYPATSLKRGLSKAAEAGLFDGDDEAPVVTIDMFK